MLRVFANLYEAWHIFASVITIRMTPLDFDIFAEQSIKRRGRKIAAINGTLEFKADIVVI